MRALFRSSIPRALQIAAAAIIAAYAAQSQPCAQAPAVGLSGPYAEWWRLYRWENGSIEAYMGSTDIAFSVFIPLANHCRTPILRPLSKDDVVTVYRGPDVRNAMPLGGAVPTVPQSVRVEAAISGIIRCEAHSTGSGENKITLQLVDIVLKDSTYKQVGPVEAIPVIPPP